MEASRCVGEIILGLLTAETLSREKQESLSPCVMPFIKVNQIQKIMKSVGDASV